MKKYILTVSLFFVLITFTGCYTVIWSPEMDFPTTETYEQEYYEEGYYPDTYYGDYGYYYQYPWWLSISPPTYSSPGKETNRDENATMSRIRNRDGSRGTTSREPVINNNPVTTSGSSGSGSSGSSGSSSSPAKETKRPEVNDSNSSTPKTGSSDSGSSGRSSSSGQDRNNNGRNNGGRK